MKLFLKLLCLIFISLNLFSEELELQSQEKEAGDVLSSSEWNSIMKKLNSSIKQVKEEMVLGNWSCTGYSLTIQSPAWEASYPSPPSTKKRTGYLLTFAAGNPGTWDASANGPDGRFFGKDAHPLTGKFRVINNELLLAWAPGGGPDWGLMRVYSLRFHGPKRFFAENSWQDFGLRNFYCDKES